jgi:hypothetical protein
MTGLLRERTKLGSHILRDKVVDTLLVDIGGRVTTNVGSFFPAVICNHGSIKKWAATRIVRVLLLASLPSAGFYPTVENCATKQRQMRRPAAPLNY